MDAQQTPQNTGVLIDGPYTVTADLAVQHARIIDDTGFCIMCGRYLGGEE